MAREPRGFGQGRVLVQRLVLAEILARRGEGPLSRTSRVLPANLPKIEEPKPVHVEPEP
jgi:hypothetical protein